MTRRVMPSTVIAIASRVAPLDADEPVAGSPLFGGTSGGTTVVVVLVTHMSSIGNVGVIEAVGTTPPVVVVGSREVGGLLVVGAGFTSFWKLMPGRFRTAA